LKERFKNFKSVQWSTVGLLASQLQIGTCLFIILTSVTQQNMEIG